MVFRFTSESGDVEETIIEQAETRNPPAQQYSMTVGDEAIEWVQIEGTTWASFGEGWFQSQEDPDDMASSFGEGLVMDPEDLADDIADYDYDYVGRETVNGISTKHYTFVIPDSEASLLTGGDAEDVEGEVWIADESGLPAFAVRYQVEWTGAYWTGEEQGTVEILYDIFEVNSSFTIEPPAWAALLYLGVMCTSVAILLWAMGLEGVSATSSATIMLLEIITALVISIGLLSETLRTYAVIGAILVLTAIYLVASGERQARVPAGGHT